MCVVSALLALVLVASGCGDSGSDNSSGSTTSAAAGSATSTAKAAVSGGTLTFGEFSEPVGLDPIVSTGQGTTGAIEMAAIYDTILRYDPATGKYNNNFAESVTSNADFTEWTLKLKPGIKFSDGTAYDAAAVQFGMNRHRSGIPGAPPCTETISCPRNSTSSSVYMALVKDIAVVDPLTVKFTLNEAWSAFPYALSAEASMIPSPTALKKCTDPAMTASKCDTNLKPIGAGPFTVDSFRPKDSINLVRNPTYFGGTVYLDGIKFVNLGDSGGTRTYEAFKTGTLQAAFLRDPKSVSTAHDDKVAGFSTLEMGGGILLMNTGVKVNCVGGKPEPLCVGKPDGLTATTPATASLKVRQAIASAINTDVINQRAYGGKGLTSSEFFQKGFRWYPNVPGVKYDLEAAKKAVTEAKAAGWDGKVRLLFNSAPVETDKGLAIQAMLQAAGMDASLDATKDTTAQIQVVATAKDFDVATWGIATSPDDGAMAAIAQNFTSTSQSNRVGYVNMAMDQAVKDIRSAKDDAAKTAAYKKVAELLTQDLPIETFAAIEEYIVHAPKVHDLQPANRASVYFDKAWIEK